MAKRRWHTFEIDTTYVKGSMYRFQEVNDIFPLRSNDAPTIQETTSVEGTTA